VIGYLSRQGGAILLTGINTWGFLLLSHENHVSLSHAINPLLIKLAMSRWIDISLNHFIMCLWSSNASLGHKDEKKNLWQ